LVLGVVALGLVVGGGSTGVDLWFARAAADPVGHIGWLRALLLLISNPGVPVFTTLTVALFSVYRKDYRFAAIAVVTPPIAVALNSGVLKHVFGRLRDGELAYPSGHTTLLVAALTVVVLLYGKALLPSLVVGLLGAFGLVAAGYHYLTDTVGGAAFAVAIGLAVYAVLTPRRGTTPPDGRPPAGTSCGTPRAASPR
jgi:membrane-associated phospholipid phosphatase